MTGRLKAYRQKQEQALADASFERVVDKARRLGKADCKFCGANRYPVTTRMETDENGMRHFKVAPGKLTDDGKLRLWQECYVCKNFQQWDEPKLEHERIDTFQNWLEKMLASDDPRERAMVPKGVWLRDRPPGMPLNRASEQDKADMQAEIDKRCSICYRSIPSFWTLTTSADGTIQYRVEGNPQPVHVHVSDARQAKMQAGRLRKKLEREQAAQPGAHRKE